jgi:hypothetical protein
VTAASTREEMMKKKLNLQLDSLAVDSFETSAATDGTGTVRALESDTDDPIEQAPCTCFASCLCPTNAYYCATVHATVISCDYTYNGSCQYTKHTCGGISCNICTD